MSIEPIPLDIVYPPRSLLLSRHDVETIQIRDTCWEGDNVLNPTLHSVNQPTEVGQTSGSRTISVFIENKSSKDDMMQGL